VNQTSGQLRHEDLIDDADKGSASRDIRHQHLSDVQWIIDDRQTDK